MTTTLESFDPYAELPLIKGVRLKLTSDAPFAPVYTQSIMSAVNDPGSVYLARVRSRQLILETRRNAGHSQPERLSEARLKSKLKRHYTPKKSSTRPKGPLRMEKSEIGYSHFLHLHHLWLGYMSELLDLTQHTSQDPLPSMPGIAGMHAKLVKADYHGSIMSVRRSKHKDFEGLSGIVIYETANTFHIFTREDKLKIIPKQNNIFSFAVPLSSVLNENLPDTVSKRTYTVLDLPHMEFELYGNQFRFRAGDRAGKKFKSKETIEL